MDVAPDPRFLAKMVERLTAVADGNRIRLLLRLRRGECNVSGLTGELGISQGSVSKHLGVLRQAGLVEVRRVGTQAIYRIRDESVFDLCRLVCDGVVRHLRHEQMLLRRDSLDGRRHRRERSRRAPARDAAV